MIGGYYQSVLKKLYWRLRGTGDSYADFAPLSTTLKEASKGQYITIEGMFHTAQHHRTGSHSMLWVHQQGTSLNDIVWIAYGPVSTFTPLNNEVLTVNRTVNGVTNIYSYNPADLNLTFNNRDLHWAVVFTPTEWKFYLDGVQVALTQGAGSMGGYIGSYANPDFVNMAIGSRWNGTSRVNSLYGSLWNYRMWAVERTATEIAENKDTVFAADTPGLIDQWLVDKKHTGNMIYGTKGNNASLVGTTWEKI